MKDRANKVNQRKLKDETAANLKEEEDKKGADPELSMLGPLHQIPLTPKNTIMLQRIIGNQGVQKLIQAKRREFTDRQSPLVQRQGGEGQEGEEESEDQPATESTDKDEAPSKMAQPAGGPGQTGADEETTAQTKPEPGMIQRQEPVGTAIAGAALAFEVLTSSVAAMQQGDIAVTWPTSEVGVRATNLPAGQRQNTITQTRSIFHHRIETIGGWEAVDVELQATVQFNGGEVLATFSFAAGGKRSRTQYDTQVNVRNPVNLETIRAPANFRRIGINEFPVVRVPIEIDIDVPFPWSNRHWRFDLMLSGMYGWGRTAGPDTYENWTYTED